jgi:hypothetical protein
LSPGLWRACLALSFFRIIPPLIAAEITRHESGTKERERGVLCKRD